jgi:IS5 family transposase
VSLWDPDARPIRKGKLGKPNEFGYVDQLCEITANTKKGARGFILPPTSQIGNPAEDTLLPDTAQELRDLDIKLKEIMVDGAFTTTATNQALEGLADTVHIAGRQQAGSRRTRRRRQRYRTGMEGRISHLKRGYGLRRSRLKGNEGHQIWDGWATLTYNLDTYTTLT